jgi:hypothetical protein
VQIQLHSLAVYVAFEEPLISRILDSSCTPWLSRSSPRSDSPFYSRSIARRVRFLERKKEPNLVLPDGGEASSSAKLTSGWRLESDHNKVSLNVES